MVQSNWLVSEKNDSWKAVVIPSLLFRGRGRTTAQQDPGGATCQSLGQVAGLSVHDRNLHHGSYFFFLDLDRVR